MRGIDVLDIALGISQCGPILKKKSCGKDFLSEGFIPLNKPANHY